MISKDFLIGVGAGTVFGGGVAALVLNVLFQKKFDKVLDDEIKLVKLDYARYYVDRKPAIDEVEVAEEDKPLKSAKNLAKVARAQRDAILEEMAYVPKEETVEADDPVAVLQTAVDHNVFDREEPIIIDRDPEKPYIISIEEFMEDEPNFDKITLTYFEEDDTLIEEKDESTIDDTDRVVGDTNLTQWGVYSKDKNTIHVRNERLECDYEITRDERSYTEVILGYKENKATKSGPKKFKGDE